VHVASSPASDFVADQFSCRQERIRIQASPAKRAALFGYGSLDVGTEETGW